MFYVFSELFSLFLSVMVLSNFPKFSNKNDIIKYLYLD